VPAVYGVTRPVRTWNPIKINFMHVWLLMKDAWYTQSWWDKLRIWFMPLGWRPQDVAKLYPVDKINDVFHFQKYDSQASPGLVAWCWAQMFVLLLLISYLFGNIASIGAPAMFIYGGFVFLTVYAYTELLDKNRFAWVWEGIKNVLGIFILINYGDWFGLGNYVPGVQVILSSYFILSTVITGILVYQQTKEIAAT
jgi:alkylglycerol monooxygenase